MTHHCDRRVVRLEEAGDVELVEMCEECGVRFRSCTWSTRPIDYPRSSADRRELEEARR